MYAELARRQPHLTRHRLRKSTLLALTWALEDECCAQAQRPWLFGAFQDEHFYRQAEPRWRDLARTAQGAWALARFTGADHARAPGAPVEVDLPADSPMTREWSLVCLAPDLPAALAAWELPGQHAVPDGDRLFESLWTAGPGRRPGRRAERRATGRRARPRHRASVAGGGGDPHPPAPATCSGRPRLFNRVLAYVDRVR